jgi:hypothetical protein
MPVDYLLPWSSSLAGIDKWLQLKLCSLIRRNLADSNTLFYRLARRNGSVHDIVTQCINVLHNCKISFIFQAYINRLLVCLCVGMNVRLENPLANFHLCLKFWMLFSHPIRLRLSVLFKYGINTWNWILYRSVESLYLHRATETQSVCSHTFMLVVSF